MPKSQKYALVPLVSGETPRTPAVTVDGAQVPAAAAHALAQVLANELAVPVSVFAPGRRSPAGLYVPQP